jgi:hypothetical protein
MFRIVIMALLLVALAGCAPVSSGTAPAVATLSAAAATVIATTAVAASAPPVATAIAPVETQLATTTVAASAPAAATLVATAIAPAETQLATSAPAVATLVTTAVAPAPTSVATPAAPANVTATVPVTGTAAASQPVIVLQRSGGVAGQTASWTVYGDGRIITGQGSERRITPDQVTQLVTSIQTLGFFNLQSSYGQNTQCRDCFNYELTVTNGGQTKTVTFVENPPDMPPGLVQVLALVIGMIGSNQ